MIAEVLTVFLVVTVGLLVSTVLIFIIPRIFPPKLQSEEKKVSWLRTNGAESRAVLLNLHPVKIHEGRPSRWKLQLQVQPANGRNFVTEVVQVLSPEEREALQVGRGLTVRYNPSNVQEIVVVRTESPDSLPGRGSLRIVKD